MKLYHGSTVIVKNPSLRQGRPNTDFGKGFYTTIDLEQATRWAQIRRERAGGGNAIVSVYTVDDDFLKRADFQIMRYLFTIPLPLSIASAMRRASASVLT